MRVKLGRKLDPGNFSVLRLLSRDDIGHEVGSGKEPTTTEDVENVEDRQVDVLRGGSVGPGPSGRHWRRGRGRGRGGRDGHKLVELVLAFRIKVLHKSGRWW